MNLIDNTRTILDFVRSIGIQVDEETIPDETFLPGILIRNGQLVIDRQKLKYPGDILHEAGHLAVMLPDIRSAMNGNLEVNDLHQGGELMAIAWSYAACIHLDIDPYIVFHEHGYKGDSHSIVENFRNGNCFGTPMLQWCGMTIEPRYADGTRQVFPYMIRWMREA